MPDLRKTLLLAADAFKKGGVQFSLIGGFALSVHGVNRATSDIDFMIDETDSEKAVKLLENLGFKIDYRSDEVIQFSGPGYVDLLLARRPLSREMLRNAKTDIHLPVSVLKAEDLIGLKIQAYKNDPQREYQDKADILSLFQQNPSMDLDLIKKYADLFNAWTEIKEIKEKIK